MMTTDLDKLRKLLPHWIEHNAEHAAELHHWAQRAQGLGAEEAAASIIEAAEAMEQANAHLAAAQAALP
jgi:hypothetical protein